MDLVGTQHSPIKKNIPINEKIKAAEVMLIDQLGNKTGICSIDDALKAAKAASLDLVQVSPSDSKPVVCKILDYGKHLFEKRKICHHPSQAREDQQ